MPSERFEVARERYHTLWPKSVYSSFGYYAQLLRFSEMSAETLVTFGIKKANRLPDEVRSLIAKKIEDATMSDLAHLYNNKHGLCTAWSVLITEAVEEKLAPANIRRFRFADAGNHRLAFDESGVLVDSAPKTVVQLVGGGSVSCGEFEYTVSSLEAENPGLRYITKGRLFSTELCRSGENALQRCLIQFLDKTPAAIAYFRTAQDDKLGFGGMIKWEKGSKVITWIEEDGTRQSAMFGPEGTLESLIECNEILGDWIAKTPTRAEQWRLIKDDFNLVWGAHMECQ